MNEDKIIYSINISDLQTVAEDELNRRLTKKEIKILEDKISDYFGWYDAISTAINKHIVNKE
jgi:ABC-type Fe3+ transport system substrate-binding protein